MNTKSPADAVVRRLERSIPVYDGRELDYSAPAVRTYEGGLDLLEDLHTRAPCARRRRRVGLVRRFWTAVAVAVGLLAGWGHGEDSSRWDAFAGVRDEPTVLGLTVTHITNSGLDNAVR